MKTILKAGLSVAMLSMLAACGGGNDSGNHPKPASMLIDFNKDGITGWTGSSSDYTPETAPTNVIFEARTLPTPLTGKGYFIGGTNRSDDLFLFVKKQFSGLEKNASYSVNFSVKLASSAPSGCMGVGGAPGEAVWVYAGATAAEPKAVAVNNEIRMNIDRGNQAAGGKDAQVLGNIANGLACGSTAYASKTVKTDKSQKVTTDANGAVWIILGIDSGFEARSEVFLQSVQIDATPVTF
ncbi:hypothetical protein [Pseudoduganella violaceinigra]|uniref:hypothetical protein n=1 Tax=Pseudoduganella violaceinigra TaxID=246602 RepID=UPI0004074F3A|nr:hypothetical protein [Pseudoduganella violaceinigra]